MYRFRMKSMMLFLIYTASIFLFALAYNMCFHPREGAGNPYQFLGDSYSIVGFHKNQAKIGELDKWAKRTGGCPFMAVYEYSQGRTAAFTEDFFRGIGVIFEELENFDKDADVAVVNEDALGLCHNTSQGTFLKIHGKIYKVLAIYQDKKDDRIDEIFYYINQDAKNLQETAGYDYVLLWPGSNQDMEALKAQWEKAFPESGLYWQEGVDPKRIDVRPSFVLITVICSILLGLNCIGFSSEWMNPQYQECGIRKLLGATDMRNHCLILKRFLALLVCAFVIGTAAAFLAIFLLQDIPGLPATRNLVGNYLYWKSALYAGVSVGGIGIVILEWNYFLLRRHNILRNIRGLR